MASSVSQTEAYRQRVVDSAMYKKELVEGAVIADRIMNDNSAVDLFENFFNGICSRFGVVWCGVVQCDVGRRRKNVKGSACMTSCCAR